jgi:hypothetical protein
MTTMSLRLALSILACLHLVRALASQPTRRANLLVLELPPPPLVPSLPALQLGLNAVSGTWCPCGASAAAPCPAGPFNVTNDILRLGPSMVRTHDAMLLTPEIYQHAANRPWGVRVFNWDSIYPDLNADPTDPKSYNFTDADRWKAEFDRLGIRTLLRLGSSVNQGAASTNISMSDVDHLSEAFLHFVKHFNDGWGAAASAHNSQNNLQKIEYVEVWNEPEGAFWTGDATTLHALLHQTISKLRKYDPSLYVGPNNACPYGDCTNNASHSDGGYEFDALDAVMNMTSDPDLLPNVYSWHEYIYQYPTLTDVLFNVTKEKLRERNFSSSFVASSPTLRPIQQIITEWNPCAEGSCLKPKETNSWAAADFGQTVMVHALLGVNVSMPYPLCAVNNDWGLVSTVDDGESEVQSHSVTWRPQAYAFEMMSKILRETPHVFSGDVTPAVSPDKFPDRPYLGAGFLNVNRTRINVVYVARMKNALKERSELRVELRNVGAAGDMFQVTCSVIDDQSEPEGVTRACVGVNGTTTSVATAMVVVVASDGSVSFPHRFEAATPSLLRVRLVKLY